MDGGRQDEGCGTGESPAIFVVCKEPGVGEKKRFRDGNGQRGGGRFGWCGRCWWTVDMVWLGFGTRAWIRENWEGV